MNWNTVSTAPLRTDTEYAVIVRKGSHRAVSTALYSTSNEWKLASEFPGDYRITHWAPLPQLPATWDREGIFVLAYRANSLAVPDIAMRRFKGAREVLDMFGDLLEAPALERLGEWADHADVGKYYSVDECNSIMYVG